MAIKNTKRKFNWAKFLIWILVLSGGGVLIWYIFFRTVPKKTVQQFNNFVEKAKKSVTDNNYIKKITFNEKYLKIYAIIVEDGKQAQYTIPGLTVKTLETWENKLKSPDAKKAFKSIDHDYSGNIDGTLYSAPSMWASLVITLLPVMLIVFAMVWMAKKSGSAGGGSSIFNPGGGNKAVKIKSDKKFSDIAGNLEVKEEVKELIDFLKKPGQYKSAGAKTPKGVLLGGPPGTGKTLIAKATAGEAGVPFYFISGSNFVEMFIGLGAKRVREMFKDARKNSPCIIFIDELDAVGRSRGSSAGGGNDEREQTLNQLLVEMDGLEDNKGVIVLAATNRPDVLDKALQRPGRFDRTITVALPDIGEREEILRLHAKGKRIHKKIDFKQVAKRTPGYSGAELANVINEAAILSVREKTDIITIEQMDEAIDRVMAGPAKKSRVISKEELTMVAYHEAGHAVIGLKVPGGQKVQKITIIPRGNAGGYNLMTPERETYNHKKSELYAKIMSFMGGRAAEQIKYGKGEISTGASDDLEKATNIARRMVTQWGMSEELGPIQYEKDNGSFNPYSTKNFSEKSGYEIDKAVRSIILKAEKEAISIISANKNLLKNIANALLEKEVIVAEEIQHIFKHGKLPNVKKGEKEDKETNNSSSLKQLIANVKDKNQTAATKAKPIVKKEEKNKVKKVVKKD